MSGLARDDGRHASARDEDGARLLVAVAVAAPLGALLWAGLIWLWRWVASSPDAALRIAAGGLLVLGSALIFRALLELERRS